MSAKEYKKKFGLDSGKGLISEESRAKSQKAVMKYYDKVVTKNLVEGGKGTRYKNGHPGRTKDMVSEQTREMLAERARKMMKKRWGKDEL